MIRPVLAFMLVVAVVVLLALLLAGRSRGKGATEGSDGHRRPVQRIEGIGLEGWHRRAVRNRRTINQLRQRLRHSLTSVATDPFAAITLIFGRYAGQAIQVAACETGRTFSTAARNGQYLGLFQMGEHERALYGHGGTALEQARAAFVYFIVSGRDWSPWACKP